MTAQAGNSRRSRAACRQQAAERALAIAPETRFAALENRAFLHRAVRYVAERGVRQYIDIGSGYPTVGPVHEVAGQIVADPHGAYVDYDPEVARFSRTLLRSANAVTVVHDLRPPSHMTDAPRVPRLAPKPDPGTGACGLSRAGRWPGAVTIVPRPAPV